MINRKHILTVILLSTSTLLFSGCVATPDTFDKNGSLISSKNNESRQYLSTAYPYYADRPYYYLNGRYYYGGYYSRGVYYYRNSIFRQGHYYCNGHRRGRKYKAMRGRYGCYNVPKIHSYRKRKILKHHVKHRGIYKNYKSYDDETCSSYRVVDKHVHSMRRFN